MSRAAARPGMSRSAKRKSLLRETQEEVAQAEPPAGLPAAPDLQPWERVHVALLQACRDVQERLLAVMDLCAEAHELKAWEPHGFLGPAEYFDQAVGLRYRTVLRLLTIRKALGRLPEGERDQARAAIAEIGTHKAGALAPLFGADGEDWRAWVEEARALPEAKLQDRVNEATGRKRDRAGDPPDAKLLDDIVRRMPPEEQQRVRIVLMLWTAHATATRNLIGGMLKLVDLAQRELGAMGVEVRAEP